MPYKPRPGCRYPYCSNRSEKGSSYCSLHKPKEKDIRSTSIERGYDYKWQKFRKEYLKKNSFCVMCLNKGKLTQSKVIDHIIPHKGDKGLFWDENNMQALCIRCHNKKTGKGF